MREAGSGNEVGVQVMERGLVDMLSEENKGK